MPPTPNGSAPELEKFPDAPPSIEVTAPEDVIDAGLRSLDHCQSLIINRNLREDFPTRHDSCRYRYALP